MEFLTVNYKIVGSLTSPSLKASEFFAQLDKINDKNVLILDDTIETGSTISETTNLILKSYVPKNITIITLFSKL